MIVTKIFSINASKLGTLLVSGNEAIVRGILESGVGFGSTYPGTPVSDVGDLLYHYSQTKQGDQFIFDYALNEKVALEEASGASWTGVRSVVIFKHLGMNVAADALHTIMYSGIGNGAGLVLIVGGDPQASSSTNAEDVRLYSLHTHLPILFPSSVEELYLFTKKAYEISEKLKIPVMVYTTPKLSFMTGTIAIDSIPHTPLIKRDPPSFERDFEKYINARHFALKNKSHLKQLIHTLEEKPLLQDVKDIPKDRTECDYAIITGGYPYLILKDILTQLELSKEIPILKLNMVYPISSKSVLNFVNECKPKSLLIIEELEPMIENEVKRILYDSNRLIPVKNIWKTTKNSPDGGLRGEIKHRDIEGSLRNIFKIRTPKGFKAYFDKISSDILNIPQREPTFCPGCSHRNVFYALRKVADDLKKNQMLDLIFGGDIGCYTLGMSPPWSVMDWLICMGAGIGIANGVGRTLELYNNTSQHVVALIGDSTLFHSGIQPLLNVLKQNLDITILILNNYYVAMTGHQPSLTGNPVEKQLDAGFQDSQLKLDEFIKNLGKSQLHVVGGYDTHLLEKTFRKVFTQKYKGTRLVVVNAECALAVKRRAKDKWDKPRGKERGEELYIQINESCPMCHECFRDFGCTAIKLTKKDGRLLYYIDESACMKEYCQTCIEICPNHCIEKLLINPKREEK